jgi:hypothetical protein
MLRTCFHFLAQYKIIFFLTKHYPVSECVSPVPSSPSKTLSAYTQTEPENDNMGFLSLRTGLCLRQVTI